MARRKEPGTIEGEVVEAQPSQALQLAAPANIAMLSPVVDLVTAQRQLAEFQTFVSNYLVEGKEGEGDFGTLPGTKKKCLHQSGAHKLCELYGFAPTFPDNRIRRTERWDMTPPLFDYEVTCVLLRKGTSFVIAEGLGSCSSYETKYKYRQSERKCPNCGAAAIIKGKDFDNTGEPTGWLCFRKKGGCGEKYLDGDQRIEGQTIGRVLNEDMADSKNTILKIAVKRSLVSATIAATRSSGLFTPDMEHAETTGEPESNGNAEAGESKGKGNATTKKFSGKVNQVRPLESDGHRVLLLSLEWNVKKKGKNNKWTTTQDKAIVAAEQENFVRLLEGSLNTKIEILCSQQPGAKGKAYWRIEKIISGGNEAGFEKDKADMKPGEDNKGHGNEGTQKSQAETPKAETAQKAAAEPKAGKPKETTAAKPAAQPASKEPQPAPVMQKVPRTVTVGGKKRNVEWMQVRGKIAALAPAQKTGSGSLYMTVLIAGLPVGFTTEGKSIIEERKAVHGTFFLRHKHLFEAMTTAKVGDSIVFCYEPETTKEGIIWQNIEDLEWIAAQEFMNGKIVLQGYDQVPK